MITLITIIHILTAAVLVLSVLLQSSKGSDVAGAFGGMGSQAAFGPRGTATFLSKSTVVLAIIFVITSVSLVRMGTGNVGGGDSVLSEEPVAEAPAGGPIAPTVSVETEPGINIPPPRVEVITPNSPPSGAATTPAPAAAPATAPATAPPSPTDGQ